jgi:hypothetical protein
VADSLDAYDMLSIRRNRNYALVTLHGLGLHRRQQGCPGWHLPLQASILGASALVCHSSRKQWSDRPGTLQIRVTHASAAAIRRAA